ncbi:2-dehydropantoate 2-reductase [Horticoccus luteus]|uniref:2-dehydropantoate 2-reductase n=1 Tax=Horticoccus luteus TaxID=2862869 RepID=A0A8F9XK54_9BACT|nr:2-dehydropantoate 2-reductase [Horticoccus luteus]QYM77739.1 2-dehydropantoate 2-reductase [Horticoccus luteus]
MPRVAIIGPGAIGGVLATHLMQTGRHDVVLCARRPIEVLTAETADGPLSVRPRVVIRPDAAPTVDWVLVTTKSYDAAGAAAWFGPLCGPATVVAVLQNGVEHRERFRAFVPADRLLPVVVDLSAERIEPSLIRQRSRGLLTVADDRHGRDFTGLFADTTIATCLTDDFKSAAWRKLCVNAAGVVSALLLRPACVVRDEQVAQLARAIVRETIAVGRAEGAILPDSLVDDVIAREQAAPPNAINSLHADRAAGRPMEVDARNGVIVRLGRKHGIATPCNAMAVTLLTAM